MKDMWIVKYSIRGIRVDVCSFVWSDKSKAQEHASNIMQDRRIEWARVCHATVV